MIERDADRIAIGLLLVLSAAAIVAAPDHAPAALACRR